MSKFLLLALISFSAIAQIKYSPLHNHTQEEKELVQVAERLSNEMAHSKAFLQFMLDREAGKHSESYKLNTTGGRTAQQVVDHIKELSLSVPVHMYYKRFSGVVGYRNPPYPDVYTNRKFHAGSTSCARASNLMHEWSHSAGYDHSFNATYARKYTVPYSINDAFEELCSCEGLKDCKIKDVISQVIIEEPKAPEFKTVCTRLWYTLWIAKRCYTVEVN